MTNSDKAAIPTEALDADILQELADHQSPVDLPPALRQRMKTTLLANVRNEKQGLSPGFVTLRASEGDWVEAAPGGKVKILMTDESTGAITYLAKLEPGFTLPGHFHDIGEECLMLEGELQLGDISLNEGDFHYAPPGVSHGNLHSKSGALVLLRGALPV